MLSEAKFFIYDFHEGYVISSTGEVVERIYDYSGTYSEDYGRSRQDRQVLQPGLSKYYRNRALYEKARKLEKSGFVVNYDRLFSVGFKRSLQKQSSLRVELFFKESGILPELEAILKEIEMKEPHVLARSRRSQLLIAYALRELRAGRTPAYSNVKKLVRRGLFRDALKIALKLHKELEGRGVDAPR